MYRNALILTVAVLSCTLESEEISVVDRGHGLYYGITWDASWIYVAARWYPPLVPTAHIERPRLLVFDRDLKFVERQRFLSLIHI